MREEEVEEAVDLLAGQETTRELLRLILNTLEDQREELKEIRQRLEAIEHDTIRTNC